MIDRSLKTTRRQQEQGRRLIDERAGRWFSIKRLLRTIRSWLKQHVSPADLPGGPRAALPTKGISDDFPIDERPREQPLLYQVGPVVRYGFAVGSVVLALLVTYFIKPLREQPPTLLFFTAVILTSWYGGMRAGLCASILSIASLDVVFVGGLLSRRMEFVDLADVIAFAGVAWLTSFTQDRWRRAHRTLVMVEEEMYLARQIQHRLFPAKAPDLPGFDVAGACFPADATGGDFFDYIPMPDNCVGVCIGDVSSHGVGPALVMALIRAYLRALSRAQPDPGVILSETNHIVCDDLEAGRFATVFLCRLEPQTRSMIYAGAGHESYLLRVSGESIVLGSTGLPLGIIQDRKIGAAPAITLQPGELVLLVSDGILESVSAAGTLFSLTQALDVVRANRHLPAAEIVATLCRAAQDYGRHAPQRDDMTVVVIKVRAGHDPRA